MRCVACDCELKEHESKRKGLFSREYIDLCDACFLTIADDFPLATGNDAVDDDLRKEYSNPTSPTWEDDSNENFD